MGPLRGNSIIGIAGKLGSGKSKAAQILDEILTEHEVPHRRYALATELKRILHDEFGWKGIKPLPPKERAAAQILGTELGRNCFGEDVWIEKLENVITRSELGPHIAIVDDVRFPNEAQWVRTHGLLLFMDGRAAENVGVQGHASEDVDHARHNATIIDNSEHLGHLYDQLLGFCVQYHLIEEPSDLFAPEVSADLPL